MAVSHTAMWHVRRWLCCSWLVVAALGGSSFAKSEFQFHHEHVLGTSLELRLIADSNEAADSAETVVLAEIERLAHVVSSYDQASEFSRWQARQGTPVAVSADLFEVLSLTEDWMVRSSGAFNPAAHQFSRVWKAAQQSHTLPTVARLQETASAVAQAHWQRSNAQSPGNLTVSHLTDVPLSLDGIAKGWIVETACQSALKVPGIRGVVLNIGGDLRAAGNPIETVQIADPFKDEVNGRPVATIYVRDQAVATSGSYRRGFQVAGKWYSHIIDPRTGNPASHVASATVVSGSSADADALATVLNVLPINQGLELVATLADTECLIIDAAGKRFTSAGWSHLEQPGLLRLASQVTKRAAAERSSTVALLPDDQPGADATEGGDAAEKQESLGAESELLELIVNFELARPDGSSYRRPYLAIWLEDADEFPVKTALLWMQTKNPGPRWHRDLLRWHRNDLARKAADGTNLIGTISSATRGPGKYKAVFDGRDDAGQPLKPGAYTLFIEVVREHGTYQLIRQKVTLGADAIPETKLKENVEIKSASYEYRARTDDAPAAAPAR